MHKYIITAVLAGTSLASVAQTSITPGKIPADAIKSMSPEEIKQYKALQEDRAREMLWDTSRTPTLVGRDKANAAKHKPTDLIIFGKLKSKGREDMTIEHEYIPQMRVLPNSLRAQAKLRNPAEFDDVAEGDRVMAIIETVPTADFQRPVLRIAGIFKADPAGKPIEAPKH